MLNLLLRNWTPWKTVIERIADLLEQEHALLKTCVKLSLELSEQRQKAAQKLVLGVESETERPQNEWRTLCNLF